jgi:hypothetical protein
LARLEWCLPGRIFMVSGKGGAAGVTAEPPAWSATSPTRYCRRSDTMDLKARA